MLKGWAKHLLLAREKTIGDDFQLVPASDDASFRRYFRASAAGDEGMLMSRKYVFVDAPPTHENNQAFLQIRDLLAAAGVAESEVANICVSPSMPSKVGGAYMPLQNHGSSLASSALKSLLATQSISAADLICGSALELIALQVIRLVNSMLLETVASRIFLKCGNMCWRQ